MTALDLPDEFNYKGYIHGYKAVIGNTGDLLIAELLILNSPELKICPISYNRARSNTAVVTNLYRHYIDPIQNDDIYGISAYELYSWWFLTSFKNETIDQYLRTKYIIGEKVCADAIDMNYKNPCSNGINFFFQKIDAIQYCNEYWFSSVLTRYRLLLQGLKEEGESDE